MEGTCLFCEIVRDRSRVPHWIAESDEAFAFLDVQPIRPGHTLVVPKRHVTDLSDVTPDDAKALFDLVLEVAAQLRQRLGTSGENLLVASGPGSEQSVLHLHVHVIPRRANDNLRWDDWWRTKILPTSFAELASLAASVRDRTGGATPTAP